ncbi:hypothetical protein RFI_22046 [Reticulomyxa filosa]|uniref:SPRY domain-containing protein n=1 Tax=Reticulomyxa filosa TaxID=46433 RepID=X6MQF5_RETFI|nr:hypothetical protein RFI_22046 [Reticulomyxa filosa]|eukprot:ETO15320.1 hypothetical protein RFI_22046 [Reticulomyxa filosa]
MITTEVTTATTEVTTAIITTSNNNEKEEKNSNTFTSSRLLNVWWQNKLQALPEVYPFAYFVNKEDLELSSNNQRVRGCDDGSSLSCSRIGNLCILRDGFDQGRHLFKIKCRLKCPNLSNQIGFLTNPKCVDAPNAESLHLSQSPQIGLSYYLMSNGKLYHYNGFLNQRLCYMEDAAANQEEKQTRAAGPAQKQSINQTFTLTKWRNGDIIAILLDCSSQEITFYVNHFLVGVIKDIPTAYRYYLAIRCCSKLGHSDYQCIK